MCVNEISHRISTTHNVVWKRTTFKIISAYLFYRTYCGNHEMCETLFLLVNFALNFHQAFPSFPHTQTPDMLESRMSLIKGPKTFEGGRQAEPIFFKRKPFSGHTLGQKNIKGGGGGGGGRRNLGSFPLPWLLQLITGFLVNLDCGTLKYCSSVFSQL